MSIASLPRINRTEIDAVPVLWIDEPGPMVASLIFRVGRSDEPTPLGGITHIVEHLALARLGLQEYDHNGFVDGQMTVFTSIGRPDEVVTFLGSVVDGLTNPPLDRLLVERRILREERSQRDPNIGGAIRWYRYGHAGQGRGLGPGDDELAFDWIGPDPVASWIRERFVRRNAVLWLSGPPPSGLRFDALPEGVPAAPPSTEIAPGVPLPSHLPWDGPGASLAFTAPRTSAVSVASSIAHRRARQRLRFDRGLVYDVQFDYEPVAPETAHVVLGADCADEAIPKVADGLLGVLRDFAEDGPTPTELEQEMNGYWRQFEDRDGRISLLSMIAMDTLWGAKVYTPEEYAAMREAVDGPAAAIALREALPTLLVLANCPPLDGLRPYPPGSTARVRGREHGPAGFYLPGRKPRERLIVGDDGVMFTSSAEEWLTVRYADVVASVHETPALRALLGRDGIRIWIGAQAWKDGARILEQVDRAIPAELVACEEHGIGGLADPGQDEGGAAGREDGA